MDVCFRASFLFVVEVSSATARQYVCGFKNRVHTKLRAKLAVGKMEHNTARRIKRNVGQTRVG